LQSVAADLDLSSFYPSALTGAAASHGLGLRSVRYVRSPERKSLQQLM